MAGARGCFKNGCLGCLGLIVLLLLLVGITALVAKNDAKNSTPVDEVLAPLDTGEGSLFAGHGGRVILNLTQGEFALDVAQPGEGLRVEAIYDDEMYDLEQSFTTLPDSTWQYELNFQRTGDGLRALMQSFFSTGPSAKVTVFLPVDIPVELVGDISKGGLDADFSGLWLTSVDLKAHQGGFAVVIDEPTKEPVDSFRIESNMGGISINGIGNASPRILEVTSSMGGADVDLSGFWQNDCEAKMSVKMGGMSVSIPKHLKVLRGADINSLAGSDAETDEPVLHLRTRAQYGEIEVMH